MPVSTADARHPNLYAITPGDGAPGLLDRVEAAFAAGLGWLQLREKTLSPHELSQLAAAVVPLAHHHGARVLINDRADIATIVGADGVHLTEQSGDVATIRRAFPSLVIGASAHGLERAKRAADGGADFILLGPIFDTPSKRAYGAPLGIATLEHVATAITIPVVAVGGVGPGQVQACVDAGARGVAAIRELLGSRNPAFAVRAYLSTAAHR